MSDQYYLEISENYGHSWEKLTVPEVCSKEEIKELLLQMRKASADNGDDQRKVRFRINIIEPLRAAPKLEFVDAWLAALDTGIESLTAWLEENYINRTISMNDTPEHKVYVRGIDVAITINNNTKEKIITFSFWGNNNQLFIHNDELQHLSLE
jgi:hypothetical protein